MDALKKLERGNELAKIIKNAEEELTALFGGEAVKSRKPQTCSKCGSAEHNARVCTADPPKITLQSQT